MPRPKTYSKPAIVDAAMPLFWRRGYEATSIDDLVRETGVSRHALYAAYEGKNALFLACLEAYAAKIVSTAFAPVEAEGATLQQVETYFETQIVAAERLGLPGPGCLMANSMTELAAHDAETVSRVRAHNARLEAGFLNALSGEARGRGVSSANAKLRPLAAVLTVFTNGLWSTSRQERDGETLRGSVREMLAMAKGRLMQ